MGFTSPFETAGIMTRYRSIRKLALQEPPGRAFLIQWRRGTSGLVVMAIHGGGIEPGTTEIADAVAGDRHGFYSFVGIKPVGNSSLHLSSRLFDEAIGLRLAASAKTVVSVHGCRGRGAWTYLGGRDEVLQRSVAEALQAAGFSTGKCARFPGASRQNICNRGSSAKGVQLELSLGLRRSFFVDPDLGDRMLRRANFDRYVSALQACLLPFSAG
jgi:phage replication-related protein YjqB (UPF0714/DUF867 family)